MDAAMHNSTRIVELHSGQREPTLMNGRQFVDHLINGGLIDLNKTRVFEPAGRGHPDDIYRQVA